MAIRHQAAEIQGCLSAAMFYRQLGVEWLSRNGGTEQGCAGFREWGDARL